MQPNLFFYPPLGVVSHGDFYQFGPSECHQPFRSDGNTHSWMLEDETCIVIVMEIPGIAKEAVKIELAGNTVTISGDLPISSLSNAGAAPTAASSEVTVAASVEGAAAPPAEHFRVRERTYGHFSRSLAVPVGTEDKDVSAGLQHGLLRVTVRKGPSKSVVGKLVKVLSR